MQTINKKLFGNRFQSDFTEEDYETKKPVDLGMTSGDLTDNERDSELRDSELRHSELRDSELRDSELRDSELRDSDPDLRKVVMQRGSLYNPREGRIAENTHEQVDREVLTERPPDATYVMIDDKDNDIDMTAPPIEEVSDAEIERKQYYNEFKNLAQTLINTAVLKSKKVEEEIIAAVYRQGSDLRFYLNRMEWEKFRLKSVKSLTRKMLFDCERSGKTFEQFKKEFKEPKDIFRLTIIIKNEDEFEKTFWEILQYLYEGRIVMIEAKNFFKEGNIYKGLNCIFRTNNDDMFIFEIQFHSEASKSVKNDIHGLYEELRIKPCSDSERNDLMRQCIQLSNKLPTYNLTVPDKKYYLLQFLEHPSLDKKRQELLNPKKNKNPCEDKGGTRKRRRNSKTKNRRNVRSRVGKRYSK
jgi:hypothetical protein